MKKLFITLALILSLSFVTVNAQSSEQEEIKTLTQRVDSLEHELTFLQLKYELSELVNEMSIFEGCVNRASITLQIYCTQKDYDFDLYESIKGNYLASKERFDSFPESIDILKEYVAYKITTYPFPEKEKELLITKCNALDMELRVVESSLTVYKNALELYKKGL